LFTTLFSEQENLYQSISPKPGKYKASKDAVYFSCREIMYEHLHEEKKIEERKGAAKL
jgi:hypothetical protein